MFPLNQSIEILGLKNWWFHHPILWPRVLCPAGLPLTILGPHSFCLFLGVQLTEKSPVKIRNVSWENLWCPVDIPLSHPIENRLVHHHLRYETAKFTSMTPMNLWFMVCTYNERRITSQGTMDGWIDRWM